MSTKERYNSIIEAIEKAIQDPYAKAPDIAMEVSRSSGLGIRDMNSLFNFLLDMPAIGYIKQRKLMAAYHCLITEDTLNIDKAVCISGLENQSSFTKRFGSFFGMTPKEAFQKKDESLYEEPVTWAVLSEDVKVRIKDERMEPVKEKTVFGVSKNQYDKIMESMELQALYGLDELYSQTAFDLAERQNIKMEDSYRFLDSIHSLFEFIDEFERVGSDVSKYLLIRMRIRYRCKTRESMVRACARDTLFQFMFFKCDVSAELVADKLKFLSGPEEEKELVGMKREYIQEYMQAEDFKFSEFKKVCDYFDACVEEGYCSDSDFNEYFKEVCDGASCEDAVSYLEFNDRVEQSMDSEYEKRLIDLLNSKHKIDFDLEFNDLYIFEKEEEENSRWKDVRLDREFDEENLHYYDDDDDWDEPDDESNIDLGEEDESEEDYE